MNFLFFIDRPVFASVLSIVIVVVGLAAIGSLPVAQFPDIAPPTVLIEADYPGASAEVAAEAVAGPIERQLPGIDNLLYSQSSSTGDGHVKIELTFEIGTNLDIAAVQAQNREKLAEPQLPQEVIRQGVSVRKQTPNLVAVLALRSDDPRHDSVFLANYANRFVVDSIKGLPGVGEASVFGQQDYSMRLILNPSKMGQLGLTPSDIATVVQEQNRDFPAGTIGREPAPQGTQLTVPVITQGRFRDVKDFEETIVRAKPDGSMIRLKDLARVAIGAQAYGLEGRLDGKPSTLIVVYLAPGANALDTIRRIRGEMDGLAKAFPQGVTYSIPYNTTRFIEVSIREVLHTLAEALVLVILVVYLFLQSWRATLIPAIAVPVSLIGTFAGMQALGFSINTLTLFGMVLAIGIVVDDAIVVVENVERHMAEGLPPKAAARKAMEEVIGPVIAIVLVLCAVFLPVAFLGGIVGQMYRQFAVTIALSVILSGFVALTLSPALCALLLKPSHGQRRGLFGLFNRLFDGMQAGYAGAVGLVVRRSLLSGLVFLLLIGATVQLFRTVPLGFVPDEDQGYFIVVVSLPEGASKQRTDAVLARIERYFLAQPAVANLVTLDGQNFVFDRRNSSSATMFVTLKDWEERRAPDAHVSALNGAAYGEFAKIQDAVVLAFNAPPIEGLGASAGLAAQIQDPGAGDFRKFNEALQQFVERAQRDPSVAVANSSFRVDVPRLYARINRERAKTLGVPISQVFDTMQAYFGNLYINDFVKFGRVYRVQTEAEPEFRSGPQDIEKIYVRGENGQGSVMIPLNAVVSADFTSGPDPVPHFNGMNSAMVLGDVTKGYSTGQILDAIERAGAEALTPQGYRLQWSGIAYQQKKAGSQSVWAFGFGLLMVFLVLA
ncbi:MAG: efflux RND transporter permease subunit, partial [Nitrospiraceae bacterium]